MEKLKNKRLTEIQFSNLFLEKLCEKVNGISLLSIENLEIKTQDKKGEQFSHYLNNSYSEYRCNPEELDEIIARYINGSKTLYSEKESIELSWIIPIIKDHRFVLELTNLTENLDDHVIEKYNSDLYIFYDEDLENNISYLKKEDLKSLNLELNELKNLAIENLNSIIENIERNGNKEIFMLIAGGNYESSLILLDIWNHENFPVNGEIIVAIPARDLLFVTGSNSISEIDELKNRVKEINETGDHIVSNKLFKMNKSNIFEVWK